MYNHNLDGWMFNAMKDYNNEQEAIIKPKWAKTKKLLARTRQMLISGEQKLDTRSKMEIKDQLETDLIV